MFLRDHKGIVYHKKHIQMNEYFWIICKIRPKQHSAVGKRDHVTEAMWIRYYQVEIWKLENKVGCSVFQGTLCQCQAVRQGWMSLVASVLSLSEIHVIFTSHFMALGNLKSTQRAGVQPWSMQRNSKDVGVGFRHCGIATWRQLVKHLLKIKCYCHL